MYCSLVVQVTALKRNPMTVTVKYNTWENLVNHVSTDTSCNSQKSILVIMDQGGKHPYIFMISRIYNRLITSHIPTRNGKPPPSDWILFAKAVAVVRWLGGNQVADTEPVTAKVIGPEALTNICPMFINLGQTKGTFDKLYIVYNALYDLSQIIV